MHTSSHPIPPRTTLDGIRILQQLRQLALLALQLRIPTNMLMINENIRHASLVCHFLQSVLDRGSVVYTYTVSPRQHGTDKVGRKEEMWCGGRLQTYQLDPTQ